MIFSAGEYVDRELVLVKVGVDSKTRAEVMQITDIFRAKIVDVQPKSLTIEITGDDSKVEKFLTLMKTFGDDGFDPHRKRGDAEEINNWEHPTSNNQHPIISESPKRNSINSQPSTIN